MRGERKPRNRHHLDFVSRMNSSKSDLAIRSNYGLNGLSPSSSLPCVGGCKSSLKEKKAIICDPSKISVASTAFLNESIEIRGSSTQFGNHGISEPLENFFIKSENSNIPHKNDRTRYSSLSKDSGLENLRQNLDDEWKTPCSRSAESVLIGCPQKNNRIRNQFRKCWIYCDNGDSYFAISDRSFPSFQSKTSSSSLDTYSKCNSVFTENDPKRASSSRSIFSNPVSLYNELSDQCVGNALIVTDRPVLFNDGPGNSENPSACHQKFLSYANFNSSFKLNEDVFEGDGCLISLPPLDPSDYEWERRQPGKKCSNDRSAFQSSLSSIESSSNLLVNVYRLLAKSLVSETSGTAGKTTRIDSAYEDGSDNSRENISQRKENNRNHPCLSLSKVVTSLKKERVSSLRTNLKNRNVAAKETDLWSEPSDNQSDTVDIQSVDTILHCQSRSGEPNFRDDCSSWSEERVNLNYEFVLKSLCYLSAMLQKRADTRNRSLKTRNLVKRTNASIQFPSKTYFNAFRKSVQTSTRDVSKNATVSKDAGNEKINRETVKPHIINGVKSSQSIIGQHINEIHCRVINKRLRYSSYSALKSSKLITCRIPGNMRKRQRMKKGQGFPDKSVLPSCHSLSIARRIQTETDNRHVLVKYESKKFHVYDDTKKKTAWSMLTRKATHMLSLVYPIYVNPQQVVIHRHCATKHPGN